MCPSPGSFKDYTIYHVAFDLRWNDPTSHIPVEISSFTREGRSWFQGELFMWKRTPEGVRWIVGSWIFLDGLPQVCVAEVAELEIGGVVNFEVRWWLLRTHLSWNLSYNELDTHFILAFISYSRPSLTLSHHLRSFLRLWHVWASCECKQNTIVTI